MVAHQPCGKRFDPQHIPAPYIKVSLSKTPNPKLLPMSRASTTAALLSTVHGWVNEKQTIYVLLLLVN